MQLLPKIEIIDLCLYVGSTLIISDVHIGYEESLNKRGFLVPRTQFSDIAGRMEKIFFSLKDSPIDTIIVNGDLKHEFGTISDQEWRHTLKFIDILLARCKKIILIKGNHDAILGPIARKREVEVKDFHIINLNDQYDMKSENGLANNEYSNQIKNIQSDKKSKRLPGVRGIIKIKEPYPQNILVAHGDKLPPKELLEKVDTVIIGHEHTAVTLRDGPRVETFKCFLKGSFKGRNLIAQPSFNNLVEGTDILRDTILSQFLKQDLGNFEVYAVADKVYDFGKIKNLRN